MKTLLTLFVTALSYSIAPAQATAFLNASDHSKVNFILSSGHQ